MTELKPCPFCGEQPQDFTDEGLWYTQCINEFCIFDEGVRIELWNRRPIEDALTAENTKLRELLKTTYDELNFYISSYPGFLTPDGALRYSTIGNRIQSALDGK